MKRRNINIRWRFNALLFVMLLAMKSSAQKAICPFVYAGFNSNSYIYEGHEDDDKSDLGWLVGGGADWLLHSHWGIKTAIEITQKNAERLVLSTYREEHYEVKNYYVEMPVYGFYQGHLHKKWNFQIGAGGYLAYGFYGNMEGSRHSYRLYENPMNFKRFDYGCQLMAQVRKNHWAFSVSYEKGFVKLTDKFYKTSPYNRAFHICGTYYF